MLGRVLALHVRQLQAQLLDVGLDVHFLIQQPLGLHADVDRVRLDLIRVERGGGPFQVAAHVGQLLPHELQAVRRFGGVAVHVLLHVELADLLEHVGGQLRVGVVVGHLEDARLLALLIDVDGALQPVDHGQPAMAEHAELRARVRHQGSDLHGHAVAAGGLAELAGDQDILVGIHQLVGTVPAGNQGERLIQQAVRNVQLENLQLRAAPVVFDLVEQGRGHQAGVAGRIFAREVLADDGHAPRVRLDGQLELIHRGAKHHARGDQRGFRRGFGAGRPQGLGQRAQPRQAGYFLLHLHHRGGLVDRRRQHRVGDAEQYEYAGDDANQPFVVAEGAEQFAQVNLVIALHRVLNGGHRGNQLVAWVGITNRAPNC